MCRMYYMYIYVSACTASISTLYPHTHICNSYLCISSQHLLISMHNKVALKQQIYRNTADYPRVFASLAIIVAHKFLSSVIHTAFLPNPTAISDGSPVAYK